MVWPCQESSRPTAVSGLWGGSCVSSPAPWEKVCLRHASCKYEPFTNTTSTMGFCVLGPGGNSVVRAVGLMSALSLPLGRKHLLSPPTQASEHRPRDHEI